MSNNKEKFEALAEEQRKSAAKSSKPGEPQGINALIKKHKDLIDPPPAKTSWKADNENGQGESSINSYTGKYQKTAGKPTGPPAKKSISDLP